MYMQVPMWEPQEGIDSHWSWIVSYLMGLLGIKLGSSGRAESIFNH